MHGFWTPSSGAFLARSTSSGEVRIAQDRISNRNYLCRAEIGFQAKFEGQAPFLRSKNL